MRAGQGLAHEDGLARQKPLSLLFDLKPLWLALQAEFGCTETCAAIILDLIAHNGPISYSRNRNHYSVPTRYRARLYTYAAVVSAVDQLAAAGLILHMKAEPNARGWQSAMRATDELRQRTRRAIGDATPTIARPKECLWVRDDRKALIDFMETQATGRKRSRLETYLDFMQTVSLTGATIAAMVRIWNGDHSHGGRHYVLGGGYQTMPEKARARLLIDGESVAEPDYANMQIRMLYEKVGATPPADAYDIGAWPRDLAKKALITLLNAETHQSAAASIAHSDGRHDDPERVKSLMDTLAEPGSDEAFPHAHRLVAGMKRVHAPVAEYFHSGIGLKLQAEDSEIAAGVLADMTRRGIPVLPVHDSFVVARRHEQTCREAMSRAAHRAGYRTLEAA